MDRFRVEHGTSPTRGEEDVAVFTYTLNFPVSVTKDLRKTAGPTQTANAAIKWAIGSDCKLNPFDFADVSSRIADSRKRPTSNHPTREGKGVPTTAILRGSENAAVALLAHKAGISPAAFCEAAAYIYLYSVVLAQISEGV